MIPVLPAFKGSIQPEPGRALLDARFCRIIIAVLLLRNGGQSATITQADLDAVVGLQVMEGGDAQGNFIVGLRNPPTGVRQ
jgi:hypothetical protein